MYTQNKDIGEFTTNISKYSYMNTKKALLQSLISTRYIITIM